MNNHYNNITYEKDYVELNKQYLINNDPNLKLLSESYISTDSININIDSRKRNKNYKNIIDETFNLINNPILITQDSDLLDIYIENHNLNINDLITIENVSTKIINLDQTDIVFTNNNKFIKFNFDINNLNSNISDLNNNINIGKYENQYIEILEIECEKDFIGNIPLSFLKNKHQIYFNLLNDEKDDLNNGSIITKFFYIKIPFNYINNLNKITNFNIKFKFLNILVVSI